MYKQVSRDIKLNKLIKLINHGVLFYKAEPEFVRIKDYEVFKQALKDGELYLKMKTGYMNSALKESDSEQIKQETWEVNKYYRLE